MPLEFRERGFVIARGFFSRDECRRILADVEHCIQDDEASDGKPPLSYGGIVYTGEVFQRSAYTRSTLASQALIDFIKPIVVLDGVLVAAEVDDSGDLALTEIDSAAFRFEYRSESYQRHHYCLDLITLRGLPDYLDLLVRRMKRVFDALVEQDKAAAQERQS